MDNISPLLLSDLLALYTGIVQENFRNGVFWNRRKICIKIASLPAPRLYITPRYARRIILVMEKGRLRAHSPWRSRQHRELYRRWLSLPEAERTPESLDKILSEPAPSFYLSPARINILLYKALKQ